MGWRGGGDEERVVMKASRVDAGTGGGSGGDGNIGGRPGIGRESLVRALMGHWQLQVHTWVALTTEDTPTGMHDRHTSAGHAIRSHGQSHTSMCLGERDNSKHQNNFLTLRATKEVEGKLKGRDHGPSRMFLEAPSLEALPPSAVASSLGPSDKTDTGTRGGEPDPVAVALGPAWSPDGPCLLEAGTGLKGQTNGLSVPSVFAATPRPAVLGLPLTP